MEAYRDQYATLFNNGKKVVVIGISTDADTTLASWAHESSFPNLFASDPDQTVAKLYGSADGNTDTRNVFVDRTGRTDRVRASMKFNVLSAGAYAELGKAVAAAYSAADIALAPAHAAFTTDREPADRVVRRRGRRCGARRGDGARDRRAVDRARQPRLGFRVRQSRADRWPRPRWRSLLRSLHSIVGGVVVSADGALVAIPDVDRSARRSSRSRTQLVRGRGEDRRRRRGPARHRRRDRADLRRRVEPDRCAASRHERIRLHAALRAAARSPDSTSATRTRCGNASRGGARAVWRSRLLPRRRTVWRSPTSRATTWASSDPDRASQTRRRRKT